MCHLARFTMAKTRSTTPNTFVRNASRRNRSAATIAPATTRQRAASWTAQHGMSSARWWRYEPPRHYHAHHFHRFGFGRLGIHRLYFRSNKLGRVDVMSRQHRKLIEDLSIVAVLVAVVFGAAVIGGLL